MRPGERRYSSRRVLRIAVVVVGVSASCATLAPPAPATPTRAQAPVAKPDELLGAAMWAPPPQKREVVQGITTTNDLEFIDRGTALLASAGSSLYVIDPIKRTVVAQAAFDSERMPDRSGTPVQGATREQEIELAIWRWDAAHRSVVGAVCIGGDGEVVRGLAVWAPGREPVPRHLPADHKQECRPLAVAPDASTVLARTAPKTAQLFSVANATKLGAPIALANDPQVAAFSPDGTSIAIAGDGAIELYDVASGHHETLPAGRDQHVRGLVFDPVRRVLLSIGDVDVLAWNLAAKTSTRVAPGADVTDGVRAAAFSGDGKQLALAREASLAIVDGAAFAAIRSIDAREGRALAFAPDGDALAVQTGQDLEIFDLHARTAATAAIDAGWLAQLAELPVPPAEREPDFTRDGAVDGRVMANGHPVAGAEVRLQPSTQEWPRARKLAPLHTRTAGDGSYRFSSVARIDWGVTISAPGLTTAGYIAELRRQPAAHASTSTLEPAVTIRGIVLGSDGRPAPKAEVARASAYGIEPVLVPVARDGTFVLDHLRHDTRSYGDGTGYTFAAWLPDGSVGLTTAFVKTTTPVKAVVKLLRPDDSHVSRVRVIDETDAPVKGASVNTSMGMFVHRTGADGAYTFLGPLAPDPVVAVDGRGVIQHVESTAPGLVVVRIRRNPESSLLPLACIRYREAVQQAQHCDRVPAATRAALQDELDYSSAGWASTSGDDCSIWLGQAERQAKRCAK
jgi:hypothetical protein